MYILYLYIYIRICFCLTDSAEKKTCLITMLTFPISFQLFIRNISNLTIWYLQNHSQLKPKCGDYNASCLLAKSPGIGVPQTCLNPLSPVNPADTATTASLCHCVVSVLGQWIAAC